MIGDPTKYYQQITASAPAPVTTDFVPTRLNPRVPFWRNIVIKTAPSTYYYKQYAQNMRQTQRPLYTQTNAVNLLPTIHSYQQLPAYRVATSGKQLHSGLGIYAQRID